MSDDTTVEFSEFLELCEEAGISTDNVEVLEQDFRAGRTLADVVDAVITDYETNPLTYSKGDALDLMDLYLTQLEEGTDVSGLRKTAVKLAVITLRYIAECCHDEGKN